MKHTINILGLGIRKSYWKKLVELLRDALAIEDVTLNFSWVGNRWRGFQAEALKTLYAVKPDILFTSVKAFKTLENYEQFCEKFSAAKHIKPPKVFLFEKKAISFLSEYCRRYPEANIQLSGYGEIRLKHPEYLSEERHIDRVVPIDPAPELTLTMEMLDRIERFQGDCFVPFSDIDKILWKEKEFHPEDFVRYQKEYLDLEDPDRHYIGFRVENGTYSLISGFLLEEVIEFENSGFPIEHILSLQQFHRYGSEVEVLLFKLREIIVSGQCGKVLESITPSEKMIRRNTPIEIRSEFPVIAKYALQLLKNHGFERVVTATSEKKGMPHLLVNMTKTESDEEEDGFSLPWDHKIHQIPDLENLMGEIARFPIPSKNIENLGDLALKKRNLIHRIKELTEQQKALSKVRVLNQQEQEFIKEVNERIELINALLDRAQIWEDEETLLGHVFGDSAFIFYDNRVQLPPIMAQLTRVDRRYHMDINKIADSSSLLAIKPEVMEPFLNEGIMICCQSSLERLREMLPQFQDDLSKQSYDSITEEELELLREKRRVQKNLIGLLSLELWQVLSDDFKEREPEILSWVKENRESLEQEFFNRDKIRRIHLVSMEAKDCLLMKQALYNSLFPESITTITHTEAELELLSYLSEQAFNRIKKAFSDKEERKKVVIQEINRENRIRLSDYFEKILKELSEEPPDLLILDHDLEIIHTLFRQFLKRKLHIPIIVFFSGSPDIEKLRYLAEWGVRILYRDQIRQTNAHYLEIALQEVLRPKKQAELLSNSQPT